MGKCMLAHGVSLAVGPQQLEPGCECSAVSFHGLNDLLKGKPANPGPYMPVPDHMQHRSAWRPKMLQLCIIHNDSHQ